MPMSNDTPKAGIVTEINGVRVVLTPRQWLELQQQTSSSEAG